MKQFHSTIRKTASEFVSYLWRVRYAVFALTVYTFVLHHGMFDTLVPGIDTEHIINNPESMYDSWLLIGRQGLLLAKFLSGNMVFNPSFAVLLTLLFMIPVCLPAPFLGALAGGNTEGYRREAWLVFAFGAIVVSHPILTEQFYFTLQSAELAFSFLLLEVCLFGAHFWSSTKNPVWLFSSILLLQIPFSTYQAFVPLFIAGAVGMCLLQSLFTERSVREQLLYVGRFILLFLGGFLLNQVISRLFFMTSSYLSEQYNWGKTGFTGGCLAILSHMRDVCLGNGTFYFIEFFLLCIALFFLLLRNCFRAKKKGTNLWQLFLFFAWCASPFYLSILLGSRPVIRAQLILPFVTGATAFFCGYLFLHRERAAFGKVFRCIIGSLLILLLFDTVYREASVTSRLYYSDSIRMQGDLSLANSLQKDIGIFTGESDFSGTVIFWGRREAATNSSCIQGDIMGQSLFNWDVDVEPFSFYSSLRIIHFLNDLGASYQPPDCEQVDRVAGLMDNIPCYPAPGSILWVEDTVVVKLSEY